MLLTTYIKVVAIFETPRRMFVVNPLVPSGTFWYYLRDEL